MIRLYEIRMELDEDPSLTYRKCKKLLGTEVCDVKITKKSIDARNKKDIFFSCNIECNPLGTIKPAKKLKYTEFEAKQYVFPKKEINKNILIVGSGPAGLFSALCLARIGARPIVIERGGPIEDRVQKVNDFFEIGTLDTSTNIQFGEGGAGTFSDGKLNTGVNDERIKFVLNEFVRFGAPENILYDSAPHIGTDILRKVIKNIRREIQTLGGQVLFNTKLTDICIEGNKLVSATITDNSGDRIIECDYLLLAIGHSARDTIRMLYKNGLMMNKKPFSIGVRIEHKQQWLNKALYGDFADKLPPASYKLWTHLKNGSSLYTFCMCPGGYVVNSASEENAVVTNGMSNNSRNGANANSAILVNVKYSDDNNIFEGMELQESLERKAFSSAGADYKMPVQLLGDFLNNTTSTAVGEINPTVKPGYTFYNLNEILPNYVSETIKHGIVDFDKKIKGFSAYDAVLTGPETRSSSPVKILRDKITMQTNISGIFSAGEGGGHAGGITSSAVDGIKVAEAIININ